MIDGEMANNPVAHFLLRLAADGAFVALLFGHTRYIRLADAVPPLEIPFPIPATGKLTLGRAVPGVVFGIGLTGLLFNQGFAPLKVFRAERFVLVDLIKPVAFRRPDAANIKRKLRKIFNPVSRNRAIILRALELVPQRVQFMLRVKVCPLRIRAPTFGGASPAQAKQMLVTQPLPVCPRTAALYRAVLFDFRGEVTFCTMSRAT